MSPLVVFKVLGSRGCRNGGEYYVVTGLVAVVKVGDGGDVRLQHQ